MRQSKCMESEREQSGSDPEEESFEFSHHSQRAHGTSKHTEGHYAGLTLSLLRHLTDALIAWGPAGILLLSVLDSTGVPVSGVFDALLILIAVQRPGAAWLCAGLAVLGSTVGNTILFWTAHRGGRRFMSAATPEGRSGRFREWFRRYGMVTVFVPALVPIPMPLKVFVISAGVTGTSFTEFVGVILLARGIRYFGEAWL